MRKAARIATLILAFFQVFLSFKIAIDFIINSIALSNLIFNSDLVVIGLTVQTNDVVVIGLTVQTYVFMFISSLISLYLALTYIIFTLKNGFGAELYSWSKEKYNIFLINKKQKQEEKKEKRKQKLQQKLDKLNTKENE